MQRQGSKKGKRADASPKPPKTTSEGQTVQKTQKLIETHSDIGRNAHTYTMISGAGVSILAFSVALTAFVHSVLTFEGAQTAMMWLESLKVVSVGNGRTQLFATDYGLISWLDFCGSTLTCFAYRLEAERLTSAGDKRLALIHRTYIGFYAHSLLKCNFMQFGGTTVTAVLLGQAPSWLAGTHVFSAFLLAYWLVFCSPSDVWFSLLKLPFFGLNSFFLLPIKLFATISACHALSSWGLDKALTAEHPRIRGSVWGALACGFCSGSMGGMVAGVADEGEAWITSKAPTWAQQRTFYMVLAYYLLTDPHGNLKTYHNLAHELAGLPHMPLHPLMSPTACKVCLAMVMIVLQFALDIADKDLLAPLNRATARIFTLIFPVKMRSSNLLFKVLDTGGDGRISRQQYLSGFDILDENKDGFISRDEFKMSSCAPFTLLDKDGDNRLSRNEWEAGFDLFDIDGDGFITREEFNGSLPVFKILDSDGDGRITRKEYHDGFFLLDRERKGYVSREEFGMSSSAPFKVLDKDGDNRLSRPEWDAGFDLFDTDGDGFITKQEFHGSHWSQ